MTSSFCVTPRAFEDLKSIGRYTLRQWGLEQLLACLHALDERFLWLANNPESGRVRDDVAPGYRSYRHCSYVVFYLICEGGIDIIRHAASGHGHPPPFHD